MKRLLSLLMVLAVVAGAFAAEKVVERSAKKAPDWLGGAKGYIVLTVEAPTLGDARRQAIDEVARRIIEAVALNVQSDQSTAVSQTTTGSRIDYTETYNSLSKLSSARLPFLEGISQSKIADSYWLRKVDKDKGREWYVYSIKYPFSKAEQDQLIERFHRYDAEKESRLAALEKGLSEVDDIARIKAAQAEIDALEAYFFDDVRLARTAALRKQYRDLYSNLSLVVDPAGPGTFICKVMLGERQVATAVTPKVTSNCASQIDVRLADGAYIITYSTIDCLPEEDNYLDITMKIDGRKLTAHPHLPTD